jgi:hypothetical protein
MSNAPDAAGLLAAQPRPEASSAPRARLTAALTARAEHAPLSPCRAASAGGHAGGV